MKFSITKKEDTDVSKYSFLKNLQLPPDRVAKFRFFDIDSRNRAYESMRKYCQRNKLKYSFERISARGSFYIYLSKP